MERPHRESAQKIKDYHTYHLSGDLSEQVVGQVAQGILHFESPQNKNRQGADRRLDLDLGYIKTTCVNVQPLRREAVNTHTAHLFNTNTSPDTGHTPVDSLNLQQSRKQYGAITPNYHDSHYPLSGGSGSNIPANRGALQDHRNMNTHCAHENRITMTDDMRAELELQKAKTQTMQQQVEAAEMANALAREQQQQEAWQAALDKLEQAKKEQARKHAEKMASILNVSTTSQDDSNVQLDWINKKLAELHGTENTAPAPRNEELEKAKQTLKEILDKQQALAAQAKQVINENNSTDPELQALLSAINPTGEPQGTPPSSKEDEQRQLMEQLRAALTPKESTSTADWQKDVLRQFLTKSNKVNTTSGATTLKPDLLKRLVNEKEEFSMVDWLAALNKEEIGEWGYDESDECKHRKVRSGMLDKATTNIVHKEVWPQKNLLEDWADEEMEFKSLLFEHLVAGELRTIELCTEPAQILGRLRLLCRMAYVKLRGYDWSLIRKMYAAILRSIEVKEYTWSDNFDQFKGIL